MPTDPMTMLSQANLTGVDILVGSNKDEGRTQLSNILRLTILPQGRFITWIAF